MRPPTGSCRPKNGTRCDGLPQTIKRLPLFHAFAVGQTDDPGAVGRIDVRVRDLDDGHAVVLVELLKKLHDFAALIAVEIAGGFVRKDEAGLGDEGAGDADKLLLAAGKLIGVEILFADEVEAVEHVADDRAAFPTWDVAVGEGDLEIFGDGEFVEQVVALENEAMVFLLQGEALLRAEFMHGDAVELVFTSPGIVVEAEHMEQGGFARAGGAHDGDEVAGSDVEVDVAQGVEGPALQRVNTFDGAEGNHAETEMGGEEPKGDTNWSSGRGWLPKDSGAGRAVVAG